MFTTQHYTEVAFQIRGEYDALLDAPLDEDPGDGLEVLDRLIVRFCAMFAAGNDRFDRRRFIQAATGSIDLHMAMLDQENAEADR
jgi:hypothetical protein